MLCKEKDLDNESSVEQFFVVRILKKLGFKDSDIKTKNSIDELIIGRGSKKEKHKPDYVLFVNKKPRIVIDAKDPKENIDNYVYQTSNYCLSLNQSYEEENPVQFFILTNGLVTKLFQWDKGKPILTLNLKDFNEESSEYHKFLRLVSYSSIKIMKDMTIKEMDEFQFYRPELKELENIFRACHDLIWKKEKIKPTEAFYEFSKIFFIKLDQDKKIHHIMKSKKPENKDFFFSVGWIDEMEKIEKNPFDTILFKDVREHLEDEIEKRKKRRIFEKGENIKLKPSTIKEVVRLLQNYDLFAIDEDLNGRMFETFLNATVRGKDLGQFFTPRSVVKFMTILADIKVTRDHIDSVLDIFCGSGGFLIEAMAKMFEKVKLNNSLSDDEKEKFRNMIVSQKLWGVDANKTISRVARMNMFLHGDGSNRIFWLPDSLDKDILIERGIDKELKEDAEEFKKLTENKEIFDVVLTNPPFSMRYESSKEDEKKVLDKYEIAYSFGKEESKKMKSSLKSNILSLERYRDLLKPHGKLITIIDESVLNASSEKDYRDFIKKNFIIKAIISLPRNTFVNQEAGVKTSVLYLMKKAKEDEKQPKIFMAISDNIGHTDSGKPCPEKNDLHEILSAFRRFENGETI
jgi:type I restriction enzyme M protein